MKFQLNIREDITLVCVMEGPICDTFSVGDRLLYSEDDDVIVYTSFPSGYTKSVTSPVGLGTVIADSGKRWNRYTIRFDDGTVREMGRYPMKGSLERLFSAADLPTEVNLLCALRFLWRKLVFRRVNLASIKTKYDPVAQWEQHLKFSPAPGERRLKFFYGFTRDNAMFANEPEEIRGKALYFNMKGSSSLHERDRHAWEGFPVLDLRHSFFLCKPEVPSRETGSIICGLPEEGPKGWIMGKWFIPSPQFLKLWEMVMFPNRPIRTPLSAGVKNILALPNFLVPAERGSFNHHSTYFDAELMNEFKYDRNYAALLELCYAPDQKERVRIACQRFKNGTLKRLPDEIKIYMRAMGVVYGADIPIHISQTT